MFVESFNLIRRIWADENFVHHGKVLDGREERAAVAAAGSAAAPAVPGQRAERGVTALGGRARYPVRPNRPLVERARHDQTLYREVQVAHGHAPAPRLYLMREIYVADSDNRARVEAQSYLLQYWDYGTVIRSSRKPADYPTATISGATKHRCCVR